MLDDWFSILYRRSQESIRGLGPQKFLQLVRPKCAKMVTEEELKKLLGAKRKLRVKFGIDPTGAQIHLGHAVPMMLLRLFKRRGHDIHFVIGDFTAQIGDPSGRIEKRPDLTPGQIVKNMRAYEKQASRILDMRQMHTHKNSKWLARMPLEGFLSILGALSLGRVTQREDFRERLRQGIGVTLREANYSALMAIDSLKLDIDIEIGAVDQLLNFMQTREIMTKQHRRPEVALVTPILEGTAGDGRKMSKTYHNYIALDEAADTQFGLIMSIPDRLTKSYFLSFGDVQAEEVPRLERFILAKPLEAKKQLGKLILSLIHGRASAAKAAEAFERRFSKKVYLSSDAAEIHMALPAPLFEALQKAFGNAYSRTRLRTLIAQGSVRRLAGRSFLKEVLTDHSQLIHDGDLVKVGKLHLFRFLAK